MKFRRSQKFSFKPDVFSELPDIKLYSANLFDMYQELGKDGAFDYTSPSGNRVRLKNADNPDSMKKTTIYFSGKNNDVFFDGLRNIVSLNVVCVKGSAITLGPAVRIRGLTVISSNNASVRIGADCLSSRDVLIYASNAHGLFSARDGSRRFKNAIEIGNHVWLGQGARILAGAQVGDGSVIGSYSVLAGRIPNNAAAAGNPCRVTSRDIFWTSRTPDSSENYFEMLESAGQAMPDFVRLTEE